MLKLYYVYVYIYFNIIKKKKIRNTLLFKTNFQAQLKFLVEKLVKVYHYNKNIYIYIYIYIFNILIYNKSIMILKYQYIM